MPPGFCANATSAADSASNHPAAASTRIGRFISIYLPSLVAPSSSWRDPRSHPAIPGPFAELSFNVRTPDSLPCLNRRDRYGGTRAPLPLDQSASAITPWHLYGSGRTAAFRYAGYL